MNNPIVSLHPCSDYSDATLQDAVASAIESVPGATDLLAPGRNVLLKPNLLSASQPTENAVNTHPRFIRAVAGYCRARGCRILIGDSCGSLTSGSTRKALEISEIPTVAWEVGAEVVNFDTAPFDEVFIPNGKVLQTINLCRAVLEADVVVTLPKLKTHGLTLLTGALKNQFGCIPGRHKKNVHLAAPKPRAFAEAVVDIFSAALPHLGIMDGIVAMEGNGPAGGHPRQLGWIVASTDQVALDAVAGKIIGYRPDQVITTLFAAQRGLGRCSLEDIEIRGTPLEKACVSDFRRPSSVRRRLLWRLIPASVARTAMRSFGTSYPRVFPDRCVGCRECIVNCPADALEMRRGRIHLRSQDCIGCGCCSEACPHSAIELTAGGILRIFR